MTKILALRHEAARLLDFPNYAAYALATRMAPSNQAVFDFLRQLARVARPAAQREFAELEAIRRPQAQCLGRRLLRRETAAEAVLDLAGRAAPVFPAAARARGLVRRGGEAVRREDRRAPGHPDVSRGRALLRDPRCRAARCVPASISTPARARRNAPARGWTTASAARTSAARHTDPGRLPRLQFPARGAPASRRCSRTTTS